MDGGTAGRSLLLACCLALAAPVVLPAGQFENIPTYWVRSRTFKIPFNFDTNPRGISEVLLHVSENGQGYRQVGRAAPNKRQFIFTANHDGTYSFLVQSLDTGGARTPTSVNGAAPSMRVCVDTAPPIIQLQASPQKNWPVAIQWDIQDDSFSVVNAYYRSQRGGQWYSVLDLPQRAKGVFGWRPNVAGPLEVQLKACDKAGNCAEQMVTVQPNPKATGGMPSAAAESGNVKYVSSRKFTLEYQIDPSSKGPSGVKSVDIWKIHQGGAWQKCRETGTEKGPAQVTVEASGRWGFRLIPRSGVGLAEPDPRPGDRPDLWVEVDEQKPQVEINRLLVGRGPDAGNLTVSWTASDKFLRARPITVSYREGEQGQWNIVARDLPNSGSYSFKPLDINEKLYQFYICVTAIDEAGNQGEAVSKEPVKVDLKVPRIKIGDINVHPDGGLQSRGAPPLPNAMQTSRQPSPAGMRPPPPAGMRPSPPSSAAPGLPGDWSGPKGPAVPH